MSGFFVTGIGTDIGKTLVSAVLVEALQADYWKPIQAGNLEYTDANFVKDNTVHPGKIHLEDYLLKEPYSPHKAAEIDGKYIDFQSFKLPKTNNHIIVEGAGGIMVPINEKYLIINLIKQLQLSVILVSMNYLGSINHTLLSIEILKQHNISIAGIIFNGTTDIDSENYILSYSGCTLIGKIPKADLISKGFVVQQAQIIQKNLFSILNENNNQHNINDISLDYESF